MPVVLPAPDEVARMNWYERDKVIHRVRTLLRDYTTSYEPVERWYRMTDEQKERNAESRTRDEEAWGESVRAEARRLAGEVA